MSISSDTQVIDPEILMKVETEKHPIDENPIVPISQRRGLLSRLCLIPERSEPHDYPLLAQLLIVFTVSYGATIGPMGGSVILPAMDSMMDDPRLKTDNKGLINISYGLYVLSLGIFPLWWSSISEIFGRRSTYVISFTIFVGFVVGCALSESMGMLMAFRVLSGAGAAAVQSVGAGTISDMYTATKRGRAMGYFYLGPLLGPLVGPIAGGALVERWGWRGTQWFIAIVGASILASVILFLPETLRHGDVPVFRHASVKSTPEDHMTPHEIFLQSSLSGKVYTLLIKPLKSLKFLLFPPVLCAVIYNTLCFSCLYFLNVSIESLYTNSPYNFSPIIVGLAYLPNTFGYIISSVLSGRYSDRVVTRVKAANNGVFIPESRFAPHLFFGAILYPLSLIMFGWTAEKHLFWFVPMIASFLYGISSMTVFGTCMTYLIDTLPGRGSSGVAVNNLCRMTMAAVATFIAQPMQDSAMGFGWMYTFWGLLGLLFIVFPLAIKKWGTKWRENHDFEKLYS